MPDWITIALIGVIDAKQNPIVAFTCPRAFAACACLFGSCTGPGATLSFSSVPGSNAVLAIFSDRPMSDEFWPIIVSALREELASGVPESIPSGGSNPPRRQDRSGSQRGQSHHHLPSWGLCARVFSWPALELRGVGMGSPQPWAHRTLYSRRMHSSGTDVGQSNLRPRPRSTGQVNGPRHSASNPARMDSHRNAKSWSRARRPCQSYLWSTGSYSEHHDFRPASL